MIMIQKIFLVMSFLLITGCITNKNLGEKNTVKKDNFDFSELTISSSQKAIQDKKINCQQLINNYLQRISHYDQSTNLNSIVHINKNALIRAKKLDRKYLQTGVMKKLHCIPIILKDNFDTADMPTEAGSIALKNSYPPDDGFIVNQLRNNDAIILAKSNMAEFATNPFETISSTHGETLNAYNLNYVPAGSSGGTASAIAANFAIIGMGTDTGNSVRGPSSHLSLVGLRPTMGTTSRDGIVPWLLNRDIAGPMTRSVTDAAIIYSIIAGEDNADATTSVAKGKVMEDYSPFLTKNGLAGVRLGVLRQIFDTNTADWEMMDLMDRAIVDLQQAGAIIVDPFQIPGLEQLTKNTPFCSRFRYDFEIYLESLGGAARIKSLDEIMVKKLHHKNTKRALEWSMRVEKNPLLQIPPCVYVEQDPNRKKLLDVVVATMDKLKIDAIIYPSWSNPPRKIKDKTSPHGNNSPLIAPHSGQPAITVPMGFTPKGLPAGLQLLARPFDEHLLFQYAFAYEQATLHRKPPKLFPQKK